MNCIKSQLVLQNIGIQSRKIVCHQRIQSGQTDISDDWKVTQRGSKGDLLYDIGQSDYNTRISSGQNSRNLDFLFAGKFLGTDADITDGSLRHYDFNTFSHLDSDYYVPPRFMEAIALFITKNCLASTELKDTLNVPLVMGVWGEKGCGKTFITQLCLKKLGVEAIIMSAGEFEDVVAGKPGRLLRERYKQAGELQRTHGKLTAIVINDIDAGLGRYVDTQTTVNNQTAVGTLMNLCDHPTQVGSYSGGFRETNTKELPRVPIIVTGNDLTTIYAPLIRDGRMQKYQWDPSYEDMLGILGAMFKDNGLNGHEVETLLNTFREQPLDFFGALRAAAYDRYILQWIEEETVQIQSTQEKPSDSMRWLSRRLVDQVDLPDLSNLPITLEDFLEQGHRLAMEQDHVMNNNLAEEYFRFSSGGGAGLGVSVS